MKFGEHLQANLEPEWREFYLDYDALKTTIKQLEEHFSANPQALDSKSTSLTVPRSTQTPSTLSQETFYSQLDAEMIKIEKFTARQVEEIRRILRDTESRISKFDPHTIAENPEALCLREAVEKAGEDFLKLEKYVNLNFTGFHKILKKHDRRLPNPCKAFYTARLHEQSWVRGDYSDVMVAMSRAYSKLRGDEIQEAKVSEKQNFVRSTRKYWVHTEDISAVKYTVLQHLPVFLQKTMEGETDSQLINSVYVDNYAMELYHGRLEKTPGAIALRFRWYGNGDPTSVFVERKTHRESWAGEVSVKERFIVSESMVLPLLHGEYDLVHEREKLIQKGKSESEVNEWWELASEVVQAINSKQLFPTMRTQYMRTAFQVPHDASVRVSLDTNLCMINERTSETVQGTRWFRDPTLSVPMGEITRFPHAVLEIKLQLEDESQTPTWVTDLINSGKLLEVHKFSKFIHGCAVLMPEEIRAMPYWIDDVTLRDSIQRSGASRILDSASRGANRIYSQLLPHDEFGRPRVKPESRIVTPNTAATYGDNTTCSYCDSCCLPSNYDAEDDDSREQPKVYFANERTFLHWLRMAITLSSIAIGVLSFDNSDSTRLFALLMLPLALSFIAYAVKNFFDRSNKLLVNYAESWDEPYGPVILTSVLMLALVLQFILQLIHYANEANNEDIVV